MSKLFLPAVNLVLLERPEASFIMWDFVVHFISTHTICVSNSVILYMRLDIVDLLMFCIPQHDSQSFSMSIQEVGLHKIWGLQKELKRAVVLEDCCLWEEREMKGERL